MRDWVLGVEGGGTRTMAVVAEVAVDGWRECGRGSGGPSNLVSVETEVGLNAIGTAVDQALMAADCAPSQIRTATLMIAGSDRVAIREGLLLWSRRHAWGTRAEVFTDGHALLALASPSEPVISVISGTGSLVLGRNATGHVERAGGWGPVLGDEGSGYWLVLETLRGVLRAADGRGPESCLARTLTEALVVDTLRDLPRVLGSFERSQVAMWAPLVVDAWRNGDPLASEVCMRGAKELADQVRSVVSRLAIASHVGTLVLSGGVLLNVEELTRQMLDDLEMHGWQPYAVRFAHDPVVGAVESAWRSWREGLPV